MPFVKVVKNKAYFKRFQVQYRRRREGKTDYRARRQMVLQDKTKFGSPKYRLVARITNKDIIAQIIQAKIKGDEVVMAAYSHELPAFGIPVGLTNYAAAYATGLLCARRILTKLELADKFEGTTVVDGKFTEARIKKKGQNGDKSARFPFKAILDVGLARTTTGARIFGVMKGAVDGGIAVPHKPNRFAGYDAKKKQLDPKAHRDRIFGQHVANYLESIAKKRKMEAEVAETSPQFSKFFEKQITHDKLEAMYKAAHAAIRANPMKSTPVKPKVEGAKSKNYSTPKTKRAVKVEAAKRKVATLRARLNKA